MSTGRPEKINRYMTVEHLDGLDIYRLKFRSLSEIELYLKEYPETNDEIFIGKNSRTALPAFAGDPLEQAIKYCLGGYEKGFPKFMQIKREIDNVNIRKAKGRRTVTSFVGARPNVPGYIAGAPKTMYALEKTRGKKFIDIYFNLSYTADTTEEQIINRGILTLNLISLLEESDIGVNFRVFQSCYEGNEIFFSEIVLKKPDEQLNVKKCYYPMCGKEFLRRVMARILESVPVKQNWGLSYGQLLPEVMNRKLFGIDDNKILILSPAEMGIKGNNIYEDADEFLSRIKLKEEIRFPKYRED